MADLTKVSGAGTEIEVSGIKYFIAPLTIGEYAELQRFIETQDLKIMLEATKDLPMDERAKLIAGVSSYKPKLSDDEINKGMASMQGIAFMLWLLARRKQPRITYDEVLKTLDADAVEKLSGLLWKMTGFNKESGAVPFQESPAKEGT